MFTTHSILCAKRWTRRSAIAIVLIPVGRRPSAAPPCGHCQDRALDGPARPRMPSAALAAAASYEVWLTVQSTPEAMVASVPDTMWTLQAQAGTTYRVRVRGVSATGVKSVFSVLSDPWVAPVTSAADLPSVAALGNAHRTRSMRARPLPTLCPKAWRPARHSRWTCMTCAAGTSRNWNSTAVPAPTKSSGTAATTPVAPCRPASTWRNTPAASTSPPSNSRSWRSAHADQRRCR